MFASLNADHDKGFLKTLPNLLHWKDYNHSESELKHKTAVSMHLTHKI